MTKKKILFSICALVLVCAISILGTLAYLTAQQGDDKALVNTFVAAGGGKIIDEQTTATAPEVEGAILQNGFYLVEKKAELVNGEYSLLDGTNVIKNTYDKAVPGMEIPKDPKLTVDVVEGVSAYIFVKVTDTTNSNIVAPVDAANWTQITEGVTLNANEKLYVYKNAAQVGADGIDLNAVSILTNDKVSAAGTLTDTDTEADGMQLGELKFEAYLCQASGFENAAAAFSACF